MCYRHSLRYFLQRPVRSLEEQAESTYSHKDAAQIAGQEFNLVLPDSKMYVHPVDLKLKKANVIFF